MRETEITVQVFEDLEIILTKLKNSGLNQVSKYQLNDWYFTNLKTNSEISYFLLLKNSFLVRQVVENEEQVYLGYKDKEVDETGKVLSEEIIKVELLNLEDSLKIFW